MKRLAWVTCLSIVFATAASSLHAQSVIYAATGSKGVAGALYTIDVNSGAILSTHNLVDNATGGGVGLTGIAFNPLTDTLYGVTVSLTPNQPNSNTVASSLVTIDPNTGQVTVIGSLSPAISDISFASDGTLYGFQAGMPYSLATIDPTTGNETTIGNANIPDFTVGGGLAFSPSGTLYLSATGATGTLDTLDRTTGTRTPGHTLSGAPNDFGGPLGNGTLNALAFDSAGTLFASNSDNGGAGTDASVELVTINLTPDVNGNLDITDLFGLPNNTDAIAFAPIPEPSTSALLAIGLVAVLCLAARRRLC